MEKEAQPEKKPKPKLEIVPSSPGKDQKESWASNLKTLTDKEAKELREPFVKALSTMGTYVDEVITITNKEMAKAKIWSTITRDEWEVVADMLLADGKKSGVIATAVRATATAYLRLQVGLITLPRVYQTWMFYADHGGFKLFPSVEGKK